MISGQHPKRAEHPDHRRLAPQLQQVDIEQSSPGGLAIGVGDGRDGIGDVVEGQELVGEFEVGHLAGRQRTLPGMAGVDLYWLPLGAGGHFVRLNGRVYEALAARLQRRPARDLYHSALQVELPEGTFVIEQAPVHDWSGKERRVVAEGAVGARWAGRFRIFRYEIRLWRGGHIPDVAEAVDSPRRLSDQEQFARHWLEVVPRVPTPVWGP